MGPRVFRTEVRRTRTNGVLTILAAASIALCGALPGISQWEDALEVDFLGRDEGVVALEPWSGWPLTVRMTVNDGLLQGIYSRTGRVPTGGATLVFDDPDGCPSWDWLYCFYATPYDETAVSFRTGALTPDPAGGEASGISIEYESLRGPLATPYAGPELGTVNDDYSYGASARLPGLVVVADKGLSIVSDSEFQREEPLKCRNLAGLMNSVAWDPMDTRGTTSLQAHMNVPEYIFEPVVRVDADVDDPSCSSIFQPDGLAPTCGDWKSHYLEPTTIRAFVVNVDFLEPDPELAGELPRPLDEIEDINGDGVCDAHDALELGYQLLSNEAEALVQAADPMPLPYDFDGNGTTGITDPFDGTVPVTSGRLVQPPR